MLESNLNCKDARATRVLTLIFHSLAWRARVLQWTRADTMRIPGFIVRVNGFSHLRTGRSLSHRANTAVTMGTTANRQKEAKKDMDHKLALSKPDRQLLEELAVECATKPSPSATFQYAFALSKSREPSELRYAVNMLDSLVVEGKFEHQVDCMYGAATALYLLEDYEEARVSGISRVQVVRAMFS